MRFSNKKEDLDAIKNIESDYISELQKNIDDYIERISEWSNSIGCALINNSIKYSTNYIYESYKDEIYKYISDDNFNQFTFMDIGSFFNVGDECISSIKTFQNEINSEIVNIKFSDLELTEKDDFEIDDETLNGFKDITKNTQVRLKELFEIAKSNVSKLASDFVLSRPLLYMIEIQNGILENYFVDQSNLYYVYLDWLKNNKDKIEKLSEQFISDARSKSTNEAFSNQMKRVFTEGGQMVLPFAVGAASVISGSKAINNKKNTTSENNAKSDKNNDNSTNKNKSGIKKFRDKAFKSAEKIGDTLIEIGDRFSPEGEFKIGENKFKMKQPNIVSIVGMALKGIGKTGQVWTGDDSDIKKGDANQTKTNDVPKKIEIIDKLNKDITEKIKLVDKDNIGKYTTNENYEDINKKVGTIIYNNPSYQQVLGLSDAKLVKLGLADDYKKATGRDISSTPINFSPYIYNGNNISQPELKVKSKQIDDLNRRIYKNEELDKINYDKIISEIKDIRKEKDKYEKDILNGKNVPYDGLIGINKETEIGKLVTSINNLTKSISAPSLLDNKNGRYNDETVDRLFSSLLNNKENSNSIKNAIQEFANRQYGYSGYRDGLFDVDNYEDLNYALNNKCNFRPTNNFAKKILLAREYGMNQNNSIILNMFKGLGKGIANIGTTLVLSAISVPVGLAFGIGSYINAIASTPRNEYKDLLDNLGIENTDSLMNDFKYDSDNNSYASDKNGL